MFDKTINTDVTMRDAAPAGGTKRFRAGDEILGRYVVESELGQGGMGVVYLCLDKVGGVKVAVKGLPPEVSHNSDEMEEVRRNFQLVCALRHPGIAGIRTLEREESTGLYDLVMDVAEGKNLTRWLREHDESDEGRSREARRRARQSVGMLTRKNRTRPKALLTHEGQV